MNDSEHITYILAGLGSEYDALVPSLTTRSDLLTLEDVYGHLITQELRLEQHVKSLDLNNPAAHFANKNGTTSKGPTSHNFKSWHSSPHSQHQQHHPFSNNHRNPSTNS
jgi:hypothetical protein